MNLIGDTISEFGRSMRLDDLGQRMAGGVVLEIDRLGALAFDLAGADGESVVVSLSRPRAPGWPGRWTEVLGRTHYRERRRVVVQAGAWGDRLVFAAVVPAAEFSLPRINEVLRELDGLHRAAEDFR